MNSKTGLKGIRRTADADDSGKLFSSLGLSSPNHPAKSSVSSYLSPTLSPHHSSQETEIESRSRFCSGSVTGKLGECASAASVRQPSEPGFIHFFVGTQDQSSGTFGAGLQLAQRNHPSNDEPTPLTEPYGVQHLEAS